MTEGKKYAELDRRGSLSQRDGPRHHIRLRGVKAFEALSLFDTALSQQRVTATGIGGTQPYTLQILGRRLFKCKRG